MRGKKWYAAGGYCAAFGAGLLIATVFPPECILIFAAAALVFLGCSRVRIR